MDKRNKNKMIKKMLKTIVRVLKHTTNAQFAFTIEHVRTENTQEGKTRPYMCEGSKKLSYIVDVQKI